MEFLKKTCPECGSVVAINVGSHSVGDEVQATCQLCGCIIPAIVPQLTEKRKEQEAYNDLSLISSSTGELYDDAPESESINETQVDEIALLRQEIELLKKRSEVEKAQLIPPPMDVQERTQSQPQHNNYNYQIPDYTKQKGKSKSVAAFLAIFLGGLGIHKFYLDKPIWGFFYLIFCWTYIPTIISFFEGLSYLFTNSDEFARRHR